MFSVIKPIVPVAIAASLLMFGNSLLGLTTTLTLNESGISDQGIGLVMSAFFLGFMISCLTIKHLIARVGHIRTFACLGAIAAAVALLQSLFFYVPFWFLLRALYGFAVAGVFTVIESWLNERTTNETRARVLTFYMASYYLASGLGQLSTNFWEVGGVYVFVVAALSIAFCLQPILLTDLPQPEFKSARPMSIVALYRLSPLAAVGAMSSGFLQSAFFSMTPVFAQDLGYSLLQVTIMSAAMVAGPFLLLWLIGRLSDRLGRRRALTIVVATLALGCALLYSAQWLDTPFAIVVALALLIGACSSSIYPNAIAHAFDQIEKDRYVATSGGLLLYFSFGAISGPFIASSLMAVGGAPTLYLYGLIGSLTLLLFILYRTKVRPTVRVVSKEEFVPVAPTSQASPVLDPRRPLPSDESN